MPSHNKLKDPFRQALLYYQAVTEGNQQLNEEAVQEAFTKNLYKEKAPSFDELALSHYIDLFTSKSRWDSYKNAFKLDRDAIFRLLDDVRKIRNKLMHFRDEISVNERKQLRFCKQWLEYHRPKIEEIFPFKSIESNGQQSIEIVEIPLSSPFQATTATEFVNQLTISSTGNMESVPSEMQFPDETLYPSDSRYAPLAFHLLSKPIQIEGELLTFENIEEIIQDKLPAHQDNLVHGGPMIQ